MVSKLGLHHRRAELRLIVDWCRSVADPDAVDGLREPERHPDKTRRNQHRFGPADRTGVDLAVHDKTFDNGSHRGCSVESSDGFDQSTLLGEGPGAERDPKIVHRERGETGVIGLPPPLAGAPQPCVHPGANRQDQSDSDHGNPTRSEIAPRPPQPEPAESAPCRGHHCRSPISALPPTGGPSETIRPLDNSITRSATLAISRLCVTTSTVIPARAWVSSTCRI